MLPLANDDGEKVSRGLASNESEVASNEQDYAGMKKNGRA